MRHSCKYSDKVCFNIGNQILFRRYQIKIIGITIDKEPHVTTHFIIVTWQPDDSI